MTSVHGVLTITALLGIYLAGCHFNDYSVDVVIASFISGAIAFVLSISGVAIGFVIGCVFGKAKRGMYFGAVFALAAVLLRLINVFVSS